MTKPEKHLFQVRLSEAERRQIKTLATSQGLTHQQALVEAFAEVLQSVDDGHPVDEVAEAFGVELQQLAKVLEFAGSTDRRG